MPSSTGKNLILSLLLSLVLTALAAFTYSFYSPPFSFVISTSGDSEIGGMSAVAGGVSQWFLLLLLIAPVLFIVIFLLLQKRSAKG
jgi:hypothetical protein